MKKLLFLLVMSVSALFIFSCGNNENSASAIKTDSSAADTVKKDTATRRIVLLDTEANHVLDTTVEVIASGYKWTEGPLYVQDKDGDFLLFSDIPNNSIFKWQEGKGASLYLKPSGNSMGRIVEKEPGSNGLILNAKGELILCQHGDRRIAKMKSSPGSPKAEFQTLADNWQGKKLNSPNDATFDKKGNLYFTDPPYGLDKRLDDTAKQLDFEGVYRLAANGHLDLLTKEIKFPNGIALSPDNHFLFVSNSDPVNKTWFRFELSDDGKVKNKTEYFATHSDDGKENGNPDGMKINSKGYLFTAGPLGVWVLNPSGKVIARIYTTELTSNCAFSKDEKTLFITCATSVLRVRLK